MRKFAILFVAGLAAALPGFAQAAEADPAAWLRQVYDLYQRAETNEALTSQASYHLVEQRASRSLAALFRRNADCEKKAGGICALDWDFVIDGQDSELARVKVGPTKIAGDRATVTVSFVNLKSPCVNVYRFVREDGAWKVDDVETKQGKGRVIAIAKLLRDFKDY